MVPLGAADPQRSHPERRWGLCDFPATIAQGSFTTQKNYLAKSVDNFQFAVEAVISLGTNRAACVLVLHPSLARM